MRNPRGFGPGGSCVIHVILSGQSESKDLLAHIGKIPPHDLLYSLRIQNRSALQRTLLLRFS